MRIGHHNTQINTNNTNKTGALLQTTGDKDEPNIVFMRKSKRTSLHVYIWRTRESAWLGVNLFKNAFQLCSLWINSMYTIPIKKILSLIVRD